MQFATGLIAGIFGGVIIGYFTACLMMLARGGHRDE